jgi:hypothetical protein
MMGSTGSKWRWVERLVVGFVVIWLSTSLLASTADPLVAGALLAAGVVYACGEVWASRSWEATQLHRPLAFATLIAAAVWMEQRRHAQRP